MPSTRTRTFFFASQASFPLSRFGVNFRGTADEDIRRNMHAPNANLPGNNRLINQYVSFFFAFQDLTPSAYLTLSSDLRLPPSAFRSLTFQTCHPLTFLSSVPCPMPASASLQDRRRPWLKIRDQDNILHVSEKARYIWQGILRHRH